MENSSRISYNKIRKNPNWVKEGNDAVKKRFFMGRSHRGESM